MLGGDELSRKENPGNAIAGAIKAKCDKRSVFVDRLNTELSRRGCKQQFKNSTVSNWCQLNDVVIDSINAVLGCDIRKFF